MAKDNPRSLGFAVVCNFDGLITQVLWDDFSLGDNLVGLSHFVCIFDASSVQKGLALFLHLKEHGAAFGWEINVNHEGVPVAFNFAGATLDDSILLLASTANQAGDQIYDGLSHVINEQINSLRVLNKRTPPGGGPGRESGDLPEQFTGAIVEDMLQLNNRLVNAERELARKNAELRRMSAVLSKDLYLAHRVLQCSGEAVMIANRDRRVVDVNQAYTTITGYGKQEVLGSDLMSCEVASGADGVMQEIWEAVATRGFWQGESACRRKSGELFPKWLTVSTVPDDSGEVSHYVVIFSDITRLKDAEERWQRLAFYDSLTELPNRVLFKDRMRQAIAKAHRDGDPLTLLYIDLDDFKVVNDSLGHDAGDRLLCEAARRIEACVRETDSICRLGGDEFAIIIAGSLNEIDALHVCDKIILAFTAPFFIGDSVFHVGASIGVARYPSDGEDPDTLTKNADAAMYAAKADGRNTSRFFSKSLGEKISDHLTLKTQMAQGLLNGEFALHLQPEIDLESGEVRCLEALLRWHHPVRGTIAPDVFIPIAEESGIIVALGDFVINEAIRLIGELRASGWPKLRIAVNVSRRQLLTPGLAETIVARLHESKLPGSALMVEITESMVMGNMDSAIQTLSKLKDHGVSAAIDDFGTGYSSLSLLRRLPVEFLKIDRAFVADADITAEGETIVRAISVMAKSLGLEIIAEGVERPEQEALLCDVGCDMGQGYWYSKPLPHDRLFEFLAEWEPGRAR